MYEDTLQADLPSYEFRVILGIYKGITSREHFESMHLNLDRLKSYLSEELSNFIYKCVASPLSDIPNFKYDSIEEFVNSLSKNDLLFLNEKENGYDFSRLYKPMEYLDELRDNFDILNMLHPYAKISYRFIGHDFRNLMNSVFSNLEHLYKEILSFGKSKFLNEISNDNDLKEYYNVNRFKKPLTRLKLYSEVLFEVCRESKNYSNSLNYNQLSKFLNVPDYVSLNIEDEKEIKINM